MESNWIKTIPGAGWFTYFRIYGPHRESRNSYRATQSPLKGHNDENHTRSKPHRRRGDPGEKGKEAVARVSERIKNMFYSTRGGHHASAVEPDPKGRLGENRF